MTEFAWKAKKAIFFHVAATVTSLSSVRDMVIYHHIQQMNAAKTRSHI